MMNNTKRRGFHPTLDLLDGRQLLSGGVSATLAERVLYVQGTSVSAPIHVNIYGGHGAPRWVVVAGVGPFRASQIRSIQVTGVAGEAVAVAQPPHRGRIPVTVNAIGDASIPGPLTVSSTSASIPTSGVTTSSPSLGTMSALEQAVVDLTNQARQVNGLPPLRVNSQLVAASQTHSSDMARLNLMEHELPGVAEPTLQSRAAAVGYNYSWLGENIAFNYADAPSVVAAWMNSPGHRANILNPNYTDIGVGIAWNSAGQPYETEEFARPA